MLVYGWHVWLKLNQFEIYLKILAYLKFFTANLSFKKNWLVLFVNSEKLSLTKTYFGNSKEINVFCMLRLKLLERVESQGTNCVGYWYSVSKIETQNALWVCHYQLRHSGHSMEHMLWLMIPRIRSVEQCIKWYLNTQTLCRPSNLSRNIVSRNMKQTTRS